MAGNVWEWTASLWDEDSESRVLRGGSWYRDPFFARAVFRDDYLPRDRNFSFGFRVVRRPPSQ